MSFSKSSWNQDPSQAGSKQILKNFVPADELVITLISWARKKPKLRRANRPSCSLSLTTATFGILCSDITWTLTRMIGLQCSVKQDVQLYQHLPRFPLETLTAQTVLDIPPSLSAPSHPCTESCVNRDWIMIVMELQGPDLQHRSAPHCDFTFGTDFYEQSRRITTFLLLKAKLAERQRLSEQRRSLA
ncbi:hypothetical protein PM082_004171 [Marasmius tenuissimus]|nr:hypothetical protein PM082_004171 [Marasmius tenuissimus]